jgi:cobalt/nickel transport system ATP-binding protein
VNADVEVFRRVAPVGLHVGHLRFAYPDGRRALDDVDLDIAPGERVAILGPNGSGKSTLCQTLVGILQPQHGRIIVDDIELRHETLPQVRSRVGLVFQDPDDMLFLPTLWQDIAFGPANQGLPPSEISARVDAALALVGLTDHAQRAPHHLSFGQRKRAATAATLSMRPGLLVMDEPSSNLDPRGRRELAELLEQLDQTLLLVTHDLPFALRLCPRAIVLDAGRMVWDGPLRTLLRHTDVLEAHALELPEGFILDDRAGAIGDR